MDGKEIAAAKKAIQYIAAAHIRHDSDYRKFDSPELIHLLKRVEGIKTSALDEPAQKKQEYLDGLISWFSRTSPLGFFDRWRVRYSLKGLKGEKRYEAIGKKVTEYVEKKFSDQPALSVEKQEKLLSEAIKDRDIEAITWLFEVGDLPPETIGAIFQKLTNHRQIAAVLKAAIVTKKIELLETLGSSIISSSPQEVLFTQILSIALRTAPKRQHRKFFSGVRSLLIHFSFSKLQKVVKAGDLDALRAFIRDLGNRDEILPSHIIEILSVILPSVDSETLFSPPIQVAVHEMLTLAKKREFIGPLLIKASSLGHAALVVEALLQGGIVVSEKGGKKKFSVTPDEYQKALIAAIQANSLSTVLALTERSPVGSSIILSTVKEVLKENISIPENILAALKEYRRTH